MWMSICSSTICGNVSLFSIVLPLLLCQKRSVGYNICLGLFLDFLLCCIPLFVYFTTSQRLDDYSFKVLFVLYSMSEFVSCYSFTWNLYNVKCFFVCLFICFFKLRRKENSEWLREILQKGN